MQARKQHNSQQDLFHFEKTSGGDLDEEEREGIY